MIPHAHHTMLTLTIGSRDLVYWVHAARRARRVSLRQVTNYQAIPPAPRRQRVIPSTLRRGHLSIVPTLRTEKETS